MPEDEHICPYTGLRSFTEEESLYFKGREDDIDQATEQLQRNKFLMLTGASGDGKSSLIYAGIIPNARAGFLKSKYTQWCVADFRPERTPFQNLCKAIARQLDIENQLTVEAELNHGFSAIIDLYKNSKRHFDTHSIAWQQADEKGKAALKREAGNLMILVDQFEEFFTNPENYHKGVPSREASLVLNLLLETARIALEEDLPIYIVFTMRSDYIGQCAAFRGLPEYIGFSQFFVPRLNRTQLQQVIEEPAILSGNRISRRLTERLIHDLTEGVDQLPILQHALNQVWHAASDGKEELDLLHYAMVGGMPVNELPDEQVNRFNNWFEDLPPVIKACYHEPNLQNVLDTHTNKLYEQAADYYLEKTGKPIAAENAKAIIKAAFICLTKIDQSRAVRNRMTLEEITHITGRPEFGMEDVGAVLNIFREPGNTFIRPFMTEDPASQVLLPGDVLDITHESLIRNWAYLEQWAGEEFDNYTISLDFEQQLNRWVDSGKSGDFLLPIGPLTYFENWFNNAKPNAHWIARYLPEEIEGDQKLSHAQGVLANAKEFIRRSARKHVITRTVMRYGAKRIALTLALVAGLVVGVFAVRNYFQRQNSYLLKTIKAKSIEIANLPKLRPQFSVPAITEQLILGITTIPEVIGAVQAPRQKIKIATGIATQLVIQGRNEPKAEIRQSLTIADSLLEQLSISGNSRHLSEGLKLIHDYAITAGYAAFFNPDTALQSFVKKNAGRSARWARQIIKEQPGDFSDIQYLSLALENGINHKIFSPEELSQLLRVLSPFENNSPSAWLRKNFQQGNVLVRGSYSYGPKHNGLYQELAYLYAAAGKPEMVLQCIDTLLRYPEGFNQSDYTTQVDNATNIAAVFYTYGNSSQLDQFVQGYCQRKNSSPAAFYNSLVSRALMGMSRGGVNVFYFYENQQFTNQNLVLSPDELLDFFYTKLKEETGKIPDNNERNFNLSLVCKNNGIVLAYRKEIRGIADSISGLLFRDAVQYYRQVSPAFLQEPVTLVGGSSEAKTNTKPRKFLFLYPDYRVPFELLEPRAGSLFYQSAAFISYVLDQQLFDSLYLATEDLRYFEPWLYDYQVNMVFRDFYFHDPIADGLLERLALKLEERNAGQTADLTILYLQLSDRAIQKNETAKGIAYLEKIQPDKIINALRIENQLTFQLTGRAVAVLTDNDRYDLAYTFINAFKREVNRSSLYGFASQQISLKKQSPERALQLLDSARAEMNRGKAEFFEPNRHQVAIALMLMNPGKNRKEAFRTIKNAFVKFVAMGRFSEAFALHSNLYKAYGMTPSNIAPEDRSIFLASTIRGYNQLKTRKPEWLKFQYNDDYINNSFLIYFDDNE
jgi:energy-coupling factor transporter ATP-binding protein EcfA2